MDINTGAPARGDNFYFRKNIISKAWDLIESGNHILIAAPPARWKNVCNVLLKG